MADHDGPLYESARLAWRLAPRLCREGPRGPADCAAMHGVWQCLRLLGLVDSIDRRGAFYDHAAGLMAASHRAPRVLICGAADHAMLEQVLAASRGLGIRPDVTIIDLCATPLAVNRRYSERASIGIRLLQQDVMDLAEPGSYDAVFTDAFLGRFSPARRPALIAKWRSLLADGGRIATSSRLRPGRAGERIAFSPQQAEALHAAVSDRAGAVKDVLGIDPRSIADLAVEYAKRHTSYAVSTLEELRSLFESGGWRIEHLATIPLPPGPDRDLGPSLRKAGEYGGVVAARA